MKLYAFSFILLAFLIVLATFVYAEVQYPVSELGNCASKQTCEAYCDSSSNMEACINFAEKNNLMTADEIAEARKFLPFMKAGTTPGQCKNQKECDAYCNNEANIIECIDFAVKVGLIDAKEAEMAKKTGGKGPGGCKREECKTYCEDAAHVNECVDFAFKYGMMDAKEAEMVKKTGGKGPGNCKGKEECDNFCNNKENFQVCIDFSVQYGLMSAEEAEMVKKTGGESPGNCKGKEECDAYCNSEEGRDVCLEFGHEHGMISDKEYNKIKQGGWKGEWSGPGGCKTEEECDAYCKTEGHMSECMDDALKNGFMTQEEYDNQMKNSKKGIEERMENNVPGDEESSTPGNYDPGRIEGGSAGGGSGGTAPGDETGGSAGDVTLGEGGVGSGGSAEPSGDSSGEAPVTGSVINENSGNGNGLLQKLIDWVKSLF